MIIRVSSSLNAESLKNLIETVETVSGKPVHSVPHPKQSTILVVQGGDPKNESLESIEGIESVEDVKAAFPLTSREFHPEDSIVSLAPEILFGDVAIGVIAGPCSVEGREAMIEIAHMVRESGACALRGGAFKPRTSPYSFQGMGEEGLEHLAEAGARVGLPVVSEIVSSEHIPQMLPHIDVFQIGARNMQNFALLKHVAPLGKPILLKRGLAATLEEWLMAAEYLLAFGAQDVVLCERGIRTFEQYTRNSLDISSIPVVKKLTHLPVIVDPSHATGIREKVPPCGLASIAAGADGLILEVHQDPPHAYSDGAQSLYPEQFESLMRDLEVLTPLVSRELVRVITPKPAEQGRSSEPSNQTIVFQGQHGSFSEQAVRMLFPGRTKTNAALDFQTLLRTVDCGEAIYGVLPVENSLMGTIHESYDQLVHFPRLTIVGELYMRIEHALIGTQDADIDTITTVYSQAPGFEQCKTFLRTHPEWTLVPYRDTAGSVSHVAEQKNKHLAAIASAEVANIHGLRVLKQGIESNPHNYTRFLVVSCDQHVLFGPPTKASLVFSITHEPGSLFRCLETMATFSLNLKKLESRPIHGKPWEYQFYLDVDIEGAEERFQQAFAILQKESASCRLLGRYKADRIF